MYALTNKSLSAHNAPLLTDLPDTIRSLNDPRHRGAFLQITPPAPSPTSKIPLGKISATRFTALHRYEPFWMRPCITNTPTTIPPETQLLLAQLPDARVALFVPLVDAHSRASLEGTPTGLSLTLETRNTAIAAPPALFIAVQRPNQPFHIFLADAAAAVADRLRIPLRTAKPLPPFIDRLGWCTWDAFYRDVSPDNIRAGLASFQAANIPLGFLIIDDGWQSEHDLGPEKGRRLTSLQPNEKFAHTLDPIVRLAKEQFHLQHVLAWHSLLGYWAGVDLDHFPQFAPREIPRNFSPGILHHFPQANTQWWGASAGIIPPAHIADFFHQYHALLRSCGIDGIKVDNQAALEAFAQPHLSRAELYAAYRNALAHSADKHFAGNLLHCMSCTHDLLYSPTSSLTRTSSDFYPGKPETHGTHLWTNALVSLWFSHFVHPDWDMFQSHLEGGWNAFHAAARAISGGPIYMSDKPGMSDAALLKRLINDDGTVPRCDAPATPSPDCIFADLTRENLPLKLCNTNRNATAGVIALFNCRFSPEQNAITATYSPSDIPAIAGHARYLAYEQPSGNLTGTPRIMTQHEIATLNLPHAGWAIATIVPLIDGIAVVGILEKLNPAATIQITRENHHLRILSRATGTLALWSDHPLPPSARQGWITTPVTPGETLIQLPPP